METIIRPQKNKRMISSTIDMNILSHPEDIFSQCSSYPSTIHQGGDESDVDIHASSIEIEFSEGEPESIFSSPSRRNEPFAGESGWSSWESKSNQSNQSDIHFKLENDNRPSRDINRNNSDDPIRTRRCRAKITALKAQSHPSPFESSGASLISSQILKSSQMSKYQQEQELSRDSISPRSLPRKPKPSISTQSSSVNGGYAKHSQHHPTMCGSSALTLTASLSSSESSHSPNSEYLIHLDPYSNDQVQHWNVDDGPFDISLSSSRICDNERMEEESNTSMQPNNQSTEVSFCSNHDEMGNTRLYVDEYDSGVYYDKLKPDSIDTKKQRKHNYDATLNRKNGLELPTLGLGYICDQQDDHLQESQTKMKGVQPNISPRQQVKGERQNRNTGIHTLSSMTSYDNEFDADYLANAFSQDEVQIHSQGSSFSCSESINLSHISNPKQQQYLQQQSPSNELHYTINSTNYSKNLTHDASLLHSPMGTITHRRVSVHDHEYEHSPIPNQSMHFCHSHRQSHAPDGILITEYMASESKENHKSIFTKYAVKLAIGLWALGIGIPLISSAHTIFYKLPSTTAFSWNKEAEKLGFSLDTIDMTPLPTLDMTQERDYSVMLSDQQHDSMQFHKIAEALDYLIACPNVKRIHLEMKDQSVTEMLWPERNIHEKVKILDTSDSEFNLSRQIDTSAIFLLDPMMGVYSCNAMDKAFQLWKMNPNRLVGFHGIQLPLSDSEQNIRGKDITTSIYGNLRKTGLNDGKYQIVSSNAVFVHRDYIQRLSEKELYSCKGLGLSIFVTAMSSLPPIQMRENIVELHTKPVLQYSNQKLEKMLEHGQKCVATVMNEIGLEDLPTEDFVYVGVS